MIYSMTGYAVRTRDIAGGTLQLELKGVNARYLDIHFKLAEEFRQFETLLRERLAARFSRGKIECRLALNARPGAETLCLNEALLAALRTLEARVLTQWPQARPLSVNDVLRWPGMLGGETPDDSAFAPAILALADEALAEFSATRAREGEKLLAVLRERLATLRSLVADVGPRLPEAQARFTEKLRQRLKDSLGTTDGERLLQEVVIFASRIDVAEELARLSTHIDETGRILDQGGVCGKRLDFLMQELNREANTLGSKSATPEISQTAVELKLAIEQMREQVQNLE